MSKLDRREVPYKSHRGSRPEVSKWTECIVGFRKAAVEYVHPLEPFDYCTNQDFLPSTESAGHRIRWTLNPARTLKSLSSETMKPRDEYARGRAYEPP